jgi:hypothetical protein
MEELMHPCDEAVEQQVARQDARAKEPEVKRAIRELHAAAQELLPTEAGFRDDEGFMVAAACAVLEAWMVEKGSDLYRRLLADFAGGRLIPGREWVRVQVSLCRFLELQMQIPGEPYEAHQCEKCRVA